MARICVAGFYGWANSGDEGILAAIVDTLGTSHEYLVATNLPYDRRNDYVEHLKWNLSADAEAEVRSMEDGRTDYDLLLYGGGRVHWGWGWQLAMTAVKAEVPVMMYGVELGIRSPSYVEKLGMVYGRFLNEFSAVTVRDLASKELLSRLGVEKAVLTMCPAVNLKEEPVDCLEGAVAVCPRYWDWDSEGKNKAQVDWIEERVRLHRGEALLIPLGPKDLEGKDVDLALCKELKRRIPDSEILDATGFEPRKIKYAISKSRLIVNGGRYHALVWAEAHGIPWEAYPESIEVYPKIRGFMDLCYRDGKMGGQGSWLKKMELRNGEILRGIMEEHGIN